MALVSNQQALIRSNISQRQRMWSSKVGALMMISSKYTKQWVQVRLLSARFLNLVRLAGPFANPNGITVHWNRPRWHDELKKLFQAYPRLSPAFASTPKPNPGLKTTEPHLRPPTNHLSNSSRQTYDILLRRLVEFTEINAYTICIIMLPCKHHGNDPWTS